MLHFCSDLEDPWAVLTVRPPRKFKCLLVAWSKPLYPQLKLNTNTSVVTGSASGGGILCDHEGRVVFAFYKKFDECDLLSAKGLSLLHGLSLCQSSGSKNLLVEEDSDVLVHQIQSPIIAKWPFCNVLRAISQLLNDLGANISYIF